MQIETLFDEADRMWKRAIRIIMELLAVAFVKNHIYFIASTDSSALSNGSPSPHKLYNV